MVFLKNNRRLKSNVVPTGQTYPQNSLPKMMVTTAMKMAGMKSAIHFRDERIAASPASGSRRIKRFTGGNLTGRGKTVKTNKTTKKSRKASWMTLRQKGQENLLFRGKVSRLVT